MKDYLRTQAALGHRLAGRTGPPIEMDDPRLIGLAGVLLPSIWPSLTETERAHRSDTAEGLELAYALNCERNAAILSQIEAVTRALNTAGAVPVLLKGAAQLIGELWPDRGARLLGDIDILVETEKLEPAFKALEGLAGLGPQDSGDSELTDRHKHALPVQGAGGAAPVELHHSLFREALRKFAPAEEIIARAAPVAVGKGRALVPCPTDQVLIAMLHGPLGGGGYLAPLVQMRDLLDINFLAKRHGLSIDWHSIEAHLVKHGRGELVEITGSCLEEFTGMPTPFSPMGRLARLDAARWRWQLDRRWTQRLGAFANLSHEAVSSLAAGGEPRRRALRYLAQPETYRRAYRRYILGEAR
ncbi:nucleotidyltransferase family protein [Tropicimonas aquimaris]|uniref:Nucleotidyltransferase family protein n=1 Tax=Tropicimonas aquimaris TaxID=914152 RepID=A0ABW3IT84_9RHOB